MRKQDIDAAIGEAYRVDRAAVERTGLDEAKRELLAQIVAQPAVQVEPASAAKVRRFARRRGARPLRGRNLALGGAVSAMAAALLLAIGVGAGPAGSPSPALAANLRLTKVSPHVLLDAPGWRMEGASEVEGYRGSINFSHPPGKPVSYLGGRLSMTFEAAAQLRWRSAAPGERAHPPSLVHAPSSGFAFIADAPVLGASARVFARTVPRWRVRQFAAVWIQSGRALQFRSFAPSLAAFERRLASLRVVSRRSWFQALPDHLVSAKDRATLEAPGRMTFVPDCDRPLPPSLAARDDLPKVRWLKSLCGFISGPFAG